MVLDWHTIADVGINDVVTGVIVILCLYVIYAFKLEHKKVLLEPVPGFKDWPIVGDVLHMKRDPIGK